MKIKNCVTTLLMAAVLPLGLAAAQPATPDPMPISSVEETLKSETTRNALTNDEWKAFGRRLTEAMESDNEGVRHAALRLAAYYGDQLQMGRQAAVSAVRVYREHPDPYMRKLAVVAIARINHPWGIDFLTRSLEYEDSVGVERVMRSALQESDQ